MYFPNVHLDNAHRRLLRATSGEVTEHLPQEQPPLPRENRAFVPRYAPSSRLDADAWAFQGFALAQELSTRLDDNAYAFQDLAPAQEFEQWQKTPALQQLDGQHAQQQPANYLHSNSLLPQIDLIDYKHPNLGQHAPALSLSDNLFLPQIAPNNYDRFDSNQQQFALNDSDFVGLPSGFHNFLPQTSAYLESAPRFAVSSGKPVGNLDGPDDELGGWEYQYQPQLPPTPRPESTLWDIDHQPQPFSYTLLHHSSAQDALPPQFPQPPRALSIAAAPAAPPLHAQAPPLPPVQHWRTDDLSWNLDSQTLDAATKSKQEIYRQKGEARRKTIAAGMAESQTLSNKPSSPVPERRDSEPVSTQPSLDVAKPAKPSRKRRMPSPDVQYGPGSSGGPAPVAAQSLAMHLTLTNEPSLPAFGVLKPAKPPRKRRKPTSNYLFGLDFSETAPTTDPYQPLHRTEDAQPPAESAQPSAPQPPAAFPTPDDLPQLIVTSYAEYKWSIHHYTLLAPGFTSAESWLSSLLSGFLAPSYTTRHLSHLTRGFIQHGTPLSLLVLHNATNPFSPDPSSPPPAATVTIGVYGLHWHLHHEIHWTTLCTDERALFTHCVELGQLGEVGKWTPSDPPSERRFHKAYWLAANMWDLAGLLNRSPVVGEKSGDVIEDKSEEDPDEDFCIEEGDFSSKWDVPGGVAGEQAEELWEALMKSVEDAPEGWRGEGGYQHVVLSSSE